jgi:NAD(P)-dependent dehydrogenase (short-subunit alcohol dehydrogenase family)
MSKDQYLAGKIAIVTGASKPNGIGAATAYTLASHGANVSTNSFRPPLRRYPVTRDISLPTQKHD